MTTRALSSSSSQKTDIKANSATGNWTMQQIEQNLNIPSWNNAGVNTGEGTEWQS